MQVNVRATTLAAALFPQQTLLRHAALVVGGSAFVALCAQVRIDLPFTPVPITGQTFAVLLVGALLGSRLGALALVAYWLEGLRFPVFAGGSWGWAVVTGTTGGYIVGFVIAAFVVGWLMERGWGRWPWTTVLAMLAGNVVIYLLGLPWLAHFVPDDKVLAWGLYPFIPGDAIKLLAASTLLPSGWAALTALIGNTMAGHVYAAPPPPVRVVTTFRIPWAAVYSASATLMVVGSFLPWGTATASGDQVTGLGAGDGFLTLAMGTLSLVGLWLRRWLPLPLFHLWQFVVCAVAGFVAFFTMVQAVKGVDYWLADVGWGLVIIAAASVILFLATVVEAGPQGKGRA